MTQEEFQYPSDRYNVPRTDLSRWRMKTDPLGRQVWHYLSEQEARDKPMSNYVAFQLEIPGKQPPLLPRARTAREGAENCLRFMAHIQDPDSGIMPSQYTGPMFMLIGYVTSKYFCDVPYSKEEAIEITRYLVNRAHPVDGGWGLHSYDHSTCFGTTINYVILRLLGNSPDEPYMVKARNCLHALGGAIGNPHWGKGYLALLNLYDWSGVNPVPAEIWHLPYWLPIHPGRWWVHTRAIYLPLGYLYINKSVKDLTPLLAEIRSEIYVRPYDKIHFPSHRNTVCGVDLYYPHTKLLDTINVVLNWYDWVRPEWVRKATSHYMMELVQKDLLNTDHLAIAPVSNALSSIVMKLEHGTNSAWFKGYLRRWPDFFAMTTEGLGMNGTNGSQVWDVAFALQSSILCGFGDRDEFRDFFVKGYRFLLRSQITDECEAGSYRDIRRGGWPFSTKIQGFPVSDCTSEALKALIMVHSQPKLAFLAEELPEDRMFDAVDLLLDMQNVGNFHFGSFASYERIKATELMEWLNPAEVFGNIMVEFPYVECTDSVVLGLAHFSQHYNYRSEEIDEAIWLALDYIIASQEEEGGFYGSWGVCYSYANMFATEALSTRGFTYANSETLRKCCQFVLSKQEEDGGWAEDLRSCELHTYVRHTSSQPVQTAWNLITLLLAAYPDREPLDRAVKFLMDRQKNDGSYDWNHVEGVFNHTCAIEYPNYRFYFTMKAMGMYANVYESSM